MKHFAELIGSILFLLSWIAGMVIAKGFWSTTAAIIVPPWGWYLLVEKLLNAIGWAAV